ncbi:MAG: DNA mismatch repair protein MutS [Planctomycetota bacterium]
MARRRRSSDLAEETPVTTPDEAEPAAANGKAKPKPKATVGEPAAEAPAPPPPPPPVTPEPMLKALRGDTDIDFGSITGLSQPDSIDGNGDNNTSSGAGEKLSPAMKQFLEVRAEYPFPEYTLLFQMGDFFELFFDDAKRVARDLGLTLTRRGKVGDQDIPLCGFPLRSLAMHMRRLLQKGHKAVVVEQIQDAKDAKGVVDRAITRIVTPGTVTDDSLLDERKQNFILAVAPARRDPAVDAPVGVAWADVSTGRFEVAVMSRDEAIRECGRLEPAEVLWPEWAFVEDAAPDRLLESLRQAEPAPVISARMAHQFDAREARRALVEHFRVESLRGFGLDEGEADPAVGAAGAILGYLRETQRQALGHFVALRRVWPGQFMVLDNATRRCLELTETLRTRERTGSLVGVLDRTSTPMGSRMLREWVTSPLTDKEAICQRHDAVEELLDRSDLRRDLLRELTAPGDLERLASRVGYGRATARDLAAIRDGLARIPQIRQLLRNVQAPILKDIAQLDPLGHLREQLTGMLVEAPPVALKEGGIVADGADATLDELRELARAGESWVQRFEAEEAERSKIASLKVGYNRVFGYYIEITHAHTGKVPAHYERKQTLKNAERYVTPELKEQESKILSAGEKSRELEYEIFCRLRDETAANVPALLDAARRLATLDVLLAFATLAELRSYHRPVMLDEPVLEIVEGRHPVVEAMPGSGEAFVPNDTHLTVEKNALIITGPNMAGKSTWIRQNALITLLAQIGSYVPARSARIGLADRIFTRLGSGDELARGQSTFMVEMTETANILNHATAKSLVILDEVGRGTSTFDGVAIAWSAMEHLVEHANCRTLFATHYHELTQLASLYPQVGNVSVEVKEWQDEIVFLHRIIDGGTDRSYGIHVGRLAGLPQHVIDRAKELLGNLESQALDVNGRPRFAPPTTRMKKKQVQLTLFVPANDRVYDELHAVDINKVTPMQALAILERLVRLAKDVPDDGE